MLEIPNVQMRISQRIHPCNMFGGDLYNPSQEDDAGQAVDEVLNGELQQQQPLPMRQPSPNPDPPTRCSRSENFHPIQIPDRATSFLSCKLAHG